MHCTCYTLVFKQHLKGQGWAPQNNGFESDWKYGETERLTAVIELFFCLKKKNHEKEVRRFNKAGFNSVIE